MFEGWWLIWGYKTEYRASDQTPGVFCPILLDDIDCNGNMMIEDGIREDFAVLNMDSTRKSSWKKIFFLF